MNIKRRRRATFTVEAVAALVILSVAAILVGTGIARAGQINSATAARIAAAQRLSETLDAVRTGVVEVKLGGETKLPDDPGARPALSCTVRAEDWSEDAALAKVTVTVTWTTGGKPVSTSAETLVRKSRLKGGTP